MVSVLSIAKPVASLKDHLYSASMQRMDRLGRELFGGYNQRCY